MWAASLAQLVSRDHVLPSAHSQGCANLLALQTAIAYQWPVLYVAMFIDSP